MHRTATALLASVVVATALPAQFPAQFTVSGTRPGANARGVSPASPVAIVFSAPVDPATVNARNFELYGRWSGPVPGTLRIDGGGTVVTFTPSRPLFASEVATLTVTRFVRAAGGAPLTGGHAVQWWVDTAPSTGIFVLDHVIDFRQPGEGLIRTYGTFAGDVDRDGAPDLTATNEVSFDVRLRKNDGCGHYPVQVIHPLPVGNSPSPNDGGDFDGDGWLDLATGIVNAQAVAVYLNTGTGNFRPPVVIPVGGSARGIAVLDFDADGDADIAATNQSNIVLLRNQGNGTFAAPVFFDGGGTGEYSLAAGDANGDGRMDLFCGTYNTRVVTVLLGDGAGTFTPAGAQPLTGTPWQLTVGDVNGDGHLDCAVTDTSNAAVAVLRGDGLGGLGPVVTHAVGTTPIAIDLGDLDGDDDLDLVTANFSSANATLLRNDGTGGFGSVSSLAAGLAGSCVTLVDDDRDGDTDLILADELTDQAFVYRQLGPDPTGVQPLTCDAALRVNGFANRGGFAGAAPHLLRGGWPAFFGISGAPGQFTGLFCGSPLHPGVPLPFGLLNLNLAQPAALLASGFLDGSGEATFAIVVPIALPTGATLAMQCLVTTPAMTVLGNPEVLTF